MRAPLVISIAFVAALVLGAAYGLGLFDAPPAATPDETPVSEAAEATPRTVTPDARAPATRPSSSSSASREDADAGVPEIRTPLPPPPTTGTLRVDSDVAGADVFLDNTFVGKTPAVVDDVTPGRHKVSVSAPGYETIAEFHDVAIGEASVTIPLKTIRLDRKVAVTHRHRFGSCEGTLVATPAGLRYETSRREDAFTAALSDLTTFRGNYVKRNLDVDVRGGRSYTFTVPDGRADELYAFYQDVEKVRQRIEEEGNAGV